jgi:hypothetical protein
LPPYTFMQDMLAGAFWLPWEDQVSMTYGTSCVFRSPLACSGEGRRGGGMTASLTPAGVFAALQTVTPRPSFPADEVADETG